MVDSQWLGAASCPRGQGWRAVAVGSVILAVALSDTLMAQTTGQVEGRTLDGSGEPLPEVTLTLKGRNLQGQRAVSSAADGGFLFATLPPGLYALSARREGFNPLEVSDLQILLDRSVRLELTLSDAFGDAVTVVERSPLVDLTRATTGSHLPEPLVRDLPTARTFEGLAILAPGVVDIGRLPEGITTKANYSIRGSSVNENRYLMDGLDITDPVSGTLQASLPPEFVEEVEIKTGGWEAAYDGALGGLVNVVTRSGGNELRGDLFGYFTDDGLQATAAAAVEEPGGIRGFTVSDFGLDLGGKLIHDRLWYFFAVNPTRRSEKLETLQRLQFEPRDEGFFWAGKLTAQLGGSSHLSGSMFGETADSEIVAQVAAGRLQNQFATDARNLTLSYSTALSPRWLLEALLARSDRNESTRPLSEESPVYQDGTGNGFWARRQDCGDPEPLVGGTPISFAVGCVGGTSRGEGESRRGQFRLSASRLGSRYELSAGIEARRQSMDAWFRQVSPYPEPLVDLLGNVIQPDGVQGGFFFLFPDGTYLLSPIAGSLTASTDELAIYIQGRWRAARNLTLSLGLRLNSLDAGGATTGVAANRRIDFGLDEMVAPRLSLVWDPEGEGRSKLFAHLSRFFESLPMFTPSGAFSDDDFSFYLFLAPFDGSLPTYENPGIHLATFSFTGGFGADPDIEPTHADELALGFEREVATGLLVGATAVYRETRNHIESIGLPLGDGRVVFVLTNPGGVYRTVPTTGEPLPEPQSFAEAVRRYRAIELNLDRRLRDAWQLQASYVYAKSEGNYQVFLPRSGQLGHNTDEFNSAGATVNAYGPLPADRPHQLKVLGSYRSPFGLVVGVAGAWLSGTPISKLGGIAPPFLAPTRFVTPRGSEGRTPSVGSLDLHLQQSIRLSQGVEAKVVVDLFNVTNKRSPIRVDEVWTNALLERSVDPNECGGPGTGPGTDCPFGNPLWGTPLEFQSPRSLRLGMKLSW